MSTKLSPLILILVIGVWFNGPSYAPYNFLIASGRPDIFARIYLVELIPFLFSLWYAIVYFGLIGAMCVITLRYILDAVLAFSITHSTKVFMLSWLQTIPAIVVAYIGALNETNLTLYAVCCALSLALSLIAVIKVMPKDVQKQVAQALKMGRYFQ
jgi:O-antigen/teichoic acid export membrane protein